MYNTQLIVETERALEEFFFVVVETLRKSGIEKLISNYMKLICVGNHIFLVILSLTSVTTTFSVHYS
jgi:hypothetical protein